MFLQTSVCITHPFTVLTIMSVFCKSVIVFSEASFFLFWLILGGFVSIT